MDDREQVLQRELELRKSSYWDYDTEQWKCWPELECKHPTCQSGVLYERYKLRGELSAEQIPR